MSREPHLPGLDLLRAFAIVAVILRHAKEILGGDEMFGAFLRDVFVMGWIGVDLFFVLSGFLIGTQLIRRRELGGFYLKRAFRILPSYYVVLLVYLVWPAFREKPELDPAWRFLLFVMNYDRQGEAFSHAWSLCVEEHFYLVFPLFAVLCAWRPRLFRPAVLVAAALGGVALLRYWLWAHDAPFYPAVYRPSHTHLDGLTVGVALALLRETRPTWWARLASRPRLLFLAGTVLVACGIYEGFPKPVSYVLSFTFVSLGFGAWVAAAATPRFPRIPGAAKIATLAFALYLTHKQMMHLAAKVILTDHKSQPFTTIALSIALIAVAASLLHYLVERPCLQVRERVLARLKARNAPSSHRAPMTPPDARRSAL